MLASLYFSFQIDFFHYVASSCHQNVVRANPVETKIDNVESLIDFTSPEPSEAATATSQTQEMSSSNNDNWDAFELSSTKNTSAAPSANTLEALLFELSVPSSGAGADNNLTDGPIKADAPSTVSGSTLTPDFTTRQTALPISFECSVAGSTENVLLQPSSASPPQLTSNKGGDIALEVINGQQPPNTQQKQTSNYPSGDNGLNSQSQLITSAVVPNFEVSCLM